MLHWERGECKAAPAFAWPFLAFSHGMCVAGLCWKLGGWNKLQVVSQHQHLSLSLLTQQAVHLCPS